MTGRHKSRSPRRLEDLEVIHNVDREALVVQIRALGEAIEHVCTGLEELTAHLPEEDVSKVRAHVDAARWSLRELW